MTNEIENLSSDLAIQADGLQVTDQPSAARATELILAGKSITKKIKEFFAPLKDAARTSWQGLVDREKEEMAKVEPIVYVLSRDVANWRAEEERKRLAAEQERLRIEREKKRLEEEALRAAEEAWKCEEEKRLILEREAERLRQEAAKAADNEVEQKRIAEEREGLRCQAEANRKECEEAETKAIEIAAEKESAMAPAPIIPEKAKTTGLAMRDNWCFEILDPIAVPREYLVIDEIKIGKVVRALKGQIEIPGVRIYNDPIMAAIGKRN